MTNLLQSWLTILYVVSAGFQTIIGLTKLFHKNDISISPRDQGYLGNRKSGLEGLSLGCQKMGRNWRHKIIPLSAYPSAYTLSPFQCSCLHLCSLNRNDLSAVCCCVPDLYPYTAVLGELSQTMHQNFQQAVSNIFTKLRGSKIYIYTLHYLFFYICVLYLVVRRPILTKQGIYLTNAICIRLLNVEGPGVA